MQWNPQTHKYEAPGVVVDADRMAEERDNQARQMFGQAYQALSDAQMNAVDRDCLDPGQWAETDDNEQG